MYDNWVLIKSVRHQRNIRVAFIYVGLRNSVSKILDVDFILGRLRGRDRPFAIFYWFQAEVRQVQAKLVSFFGKKCLFYLSLELPFGSRCFIWSLFHMPSNIFNYACYLFFLSNYLSTRTETGKFLEDLLLHIYTEIVVKEEFPQVHIVGGVTEPYQFVYRRPLALQVFLLIIIRRHIYWHIGSRENFIERDLFLAKSAGWSQDCSLYVVEVSAVNRKLLPWSDFFIYFLFERHYRAAEQRLDAVGIVNIWFELL